MGWLDLIGWGATLLSWTGTWLLGRNERLRHLGWLFVIAQAIIWAAVDWQIDFTSGVASSLVTVGLAVHYYRKPAVSPSSDAK